MTTEKKDITRDMDKSYLKEISIKDFRNIEQSHLTFSEGTNVIYGDNGNGKTNLLEAVWLLTGGKSFRGSKDRELIKFSSEFFRIDGVVQGTQYDGDEKLTLVCHSKDSRFASRMAKIGGGENYVSPTEIIGNFYRVIFSPAHLEIVGGGPAVRRRFMDACLCQLYPAFIASYRRYNRVLAQRNAFLKNRRDYSAADAENFLGIYDTELATYRVQIYRFRTEFINYLSRFGQKYYQNISGGKESISFEYNPSVTDFEGIVEKLASVRERDIAMGFTTHGPHREDINIKINGVSARDFASQGQRRSAVIAMKLSEREIMQQVTGIAPAILLDDVLSELDYSRQDYLLNNITGRQSFITSCHLERINMSAAKKFYVEGGRIEREG